MEYHLRLANRESVGFEGAVDRNNPVRTGVWRLDEPNRPPAEFWELNRLLAGAELLKRLAELLAGCPKIDAELDAGGLVENNDEGGWVPEAAGGLKSDVDGTRLLPNKLPEVGRTGAGVKLGLVPSSFVVAPGEPEAGLVFVPNSDRLCLGLGYSFKGWLGVDESKGCEGFAEGLV